ncbi:tapasin-related protein-like [Struthio camelus]|uniref:tapasin-related protein-like n=1 Tax=Struthio camelus TaxID=8801 RepID=UPI003603CA6F
MSYRTYLVAGCFLCIGVARNPNGITTAGSSFRKSRELSCVFETSKIIPLSKEIETIRLNVRLLLSETESKEDQRSHPENLRDNIPSFFVDESSVDILQHANEDINALDCRISTYFTADTQIIWPGSEVRASKLDSWFTCTIKHAAEKYMTTAFLVQTHQESENHNQGQLSQGIAEQSHLSAVFLVHTRSPVVRSALSKDVLLDCTFSIDHQADVTVQWILYQKGGNKKLMFSYNGSSKQVEHMADRAEMLPEEIPKGNASLLLRNVGMRDEGTYSCSVSVSSLTGEQTIQLQIEEKPTVTINVNSLSLVEGEQHKLICDIRNYYPLDVQAQWLRERKGSRKVPDVVKNVLSSSHTQSSNGTYSCSRYFLLTASLKDDGHRYTCRVDHQSLQSPIRRSVIVKVRGGISIIWLLLLLLGLSVCITVVLYYLHKVRSTAKPKPY